MATIDTATLIELWPIVPAIGSIITALFVVAKKAWKNEALLNEVHDEVCGSVDRPELGLTAKVAVLTVTVGTLRTQFDPFLKILDDSLSRIMMGGIKGNPMDPAVVQKILTGKATVEEIANFDAALVKDIEEKGPDALALIVVRYWTALKKAEAEEMVKQKALAQVIPK